MSSRQIACRCCVHFAGRKVPKAATLHELTVCNIACWPQRGKGYLHTVAFYAFLRGSYWKAPLPDIDQSIGLAPRLSRYLLMSRIAAKLWFLCSSL